MHFYLSNFYLPKSLGKMFLPKSLSQMFGPKSLSPMFGPKSLGPILSFKYLLCPPFLLHPFHLIFILPQGGRALPPQNLAERKTKKKENMFEQYLKHV